MRTLINQLLDRLAPGGTANAQQYYIEYKCVGNTRYSRVCMKSDPGWNCHAWQVDGTCKPIP
ncbi:hypothetical protein Afil01_31630 [Actinorhabdospora filicis]|uniref:Uncharacterized protein n=1 Tax=Actinorhabdospora filicis TaxID=1785913 RepID=A0A9W6SPH5_9ACTN|nr:hypothetical protein [Actinorhabdospora filicis]GLZ78356.1 hypothetical protein Afil01_31630 [Actinorhabdospora filicis]